MTDKIKRRHQFHIRKVPLKKFIPEKSPQLYALDVHSICLPIPKKKSLNWQSINCEYPSNFQQQFNQQIIFSQAYQQLYTHYTKLKQHRNKEKQQLLAQIHQIDIEIENSKLQKQRLNNIKKNISSQVQQLNDKLIDWRDSNYNLRWEVYHQRGTYMNAYFDQNEMTYQQLIHMQEQMGAVNRGLTLQQIQHLPKQTYNKDNIGQFDKQMQVIDNLRCCICYDSINQGEIIIILKCNHIHHCQCIKDWLIKQKLCPICKQQIVINDISQ